MFVAVHRHQPTTGRPLDEAEIGDYVRALLHYHRVTQSAFQGNRRHDYGIFLTAYLQSLHLAHVNRSDCQKGSEPLTQEFVHALAHKQERRANESPARHTIGSLAAALDIFVG